ncbi:MAG: lytic transglycosylase domain-containing protein [Clostridia bacterium]|jgi:lytic transglycosylase catalytic|nr:lytic transglycosylase domain-containing protein [Clostridia bacterium]
MSVNNIKKKRKQKGIDVEKGENERLKNKKILVCGLIILILIVFLIVFKNKIQRIFYPKLHEEFVSMYSDEYGVDENLVFAVIKAESNFQEDAVSHKDALGLMQIMKETAEDVARKYNIEIDFNNSEREILNVQNNIKIGTKYLAVLLEKYKNIEVAVAAYNAGIGTVDNWIEKEIIKSDGSDIENIPYKETNNYVRKILRNYKIYQDLYK